MNTKKITFPAVIMIAVALPGCWNSTPGPSQPAGNLLVNSFFETHGVPSLQGWIVSDTSNVRFSTDIPRGGSGQTVILNAAWFSPWPGGSIYQIVKPPAGMHRYRFSVYGKRSGLGGAAYLTVGSPLDSGTVVRITLGVQDTVWTFYSSTDTLTVRPNDIFYITVTGGETEIITGKTYFNSCTLEQVD